MERYLAPLTVVKIVCMFWWGLGYPKGPRFQIEDDLATKVLLQEASWAEIRCNVGTWTLTRV